jgi:hypothetical protein
MKNQHSFSPGLLYSVAPESFPTLHLRDDRADEFDWGASESGSFMQAVLNFLKTVAHR